MIFRPIPISGFITQIQPYKLNKIGGEKKTNSFTISKKGDDEKKGSINHKPNNNTLGG